MIFKRHPKKKYVYAVTGGKFLGELLVFIESNKENYSFLSLPDMHVREIPYEKFEFGLQEKILDVVEKLPEHVFKTCKAQYLKNKALLLQNK